MSNATLDLKAPKIPFNLKDIEQYCRIYENGINEALARIRESMNIISESSNRLLNRLDRLEVSLRCSTVSIDCWC